MYQYYVILQWIALSVIPTVTDHTEWMNELGLPDVREIPWLSGILVIRIGQFSSKKWWEIKCQEKTNFSQWSFNGVRGFWRICQGFSLALTGSPRMNEWFRFGATNTTPNNSLTHTPGEFLQEASALEQVIYARVFLFSFSF